jgi:hypothetical protein
MQDFLVKLSKAEDEENADLFLLTLYFESKDLSFFNPEETQKIKKLLSVLIHDTEKHRRLLGEAAVEMAEKTSEKPSLRLRIPEIAPKALLHSLSAERFLQDLGQAEEEEESDLFVLRMYFQSKSDLEFFTPEEAEKIRRLLSALMKDTLKHQELLLKVREEIMQKEA